MTRRYALRDDLAWLEAADGGRNERVAWVADMGTGDVYQLEGTAWLIWVLLADGAADVETLQARAASEGVAGAFEGFDVETFLEDLVHTGLLVYQDGGPATPDRKP